MSVHENLSVINDQKIKEKNFVNHYLTFRQQRGDRNTDPDTYSVGGELLSIGLRQSLKKGQNLGTFIEACRARLAQRIDEPEFLDLLEAMYFANDASGLFEVSPDFMLFKSGSSNSGNTKHVGEVLSGLLAESRTSIQAGGNNVNFLEHEILDEFKKIIDSFEPENKIASYLPFLADNFAKDFKLLCQYSGYMMHGLKAFIALYNFLYSSQLALNINSWKSEPESKPLFFILDTEKASTERKQVRSAVQELREKVADLFPMLSALEYLNQPDCKSATRYPLWAIRAYLQECSSSDREDLVNRLSIFLENYRDSRKLSPWVDPIAASDEILNAILMTSKEIFSKPGSGQLTVKKKVVSAFENEVARHFIQNRRRGGNVLTINQDYLLLLTNLAVGSESRLQFQRLIEEFQARGVWFDLQSQQALIEFYERVGNLERMSDSGDAVYVRKTI
ncbi:DNA phosphorothioation-dependent restriction protein DptG [Kushneria marisflavi]|uniref:DNA phosphorothioation-dependent restriction protein DptG n=1 Tax=Kushneria marisflavi TaxID=157779 RepID=A0A240UNQ7_9GAMM|nr:DNA phosphorothioation-dependent restriction protein DptG [Kushneria marisflavi]ART63124.1 DNA phosphorothioation-dependent restriction protein DptG [Kushneria marisflavi]RKD84622.1 DNA phosphorothioation-dependent restriction protein DptG [Kushneria marisflavi]